MNDALQKKLNALRQPELSLWAPGPHMLTPAVREVLATYQTTYSHRSSEFKTCYQKAADLLREIFAIPAGFTPLIFGHTGSYDWEMVAVNTPSDFRTLGMDIGSFSQKWAQVFQNRGRHIDTLKAPWGHGIASETWTDALKKNYDLALIIHNETATGVMQPVDELCATARRIAPNTLLAIDGVSIAGAVDMPIEALRPDYYLWSLQKDFSMPTIGSVMVVSDRAFDIAAKTPHRGYVLDLLEWRKYAETHQTPMTVPDLTLRCLIARLEEMRAEGKNRFLRHQNLSQMQRDWAAKHGLSLMAQPGYESLTVSAIRLPKHIAGPAFVAQVKKWLHVQIGAGYGPTRDEAFRIAAMGHTSEPDMARILKGLSLIIEHWDELKA